MDFLQWLSDAFKGILDALYDILPKSPFTYLASNSVVSQYIGYVNYFLPVYLWISILNTWLTAIGVYYCVKIIWKWIKIE